MGWVAFAVVVVFFLVFIAWQYKREADAARSALCETAAYGERIVERNPLMHSKPSKSKNAPITNYHQICSDADLTDEDVSVFSHRGYMQDRFRNENRKPTKYDVCFQCEIAL